MVGYLGYPVRFWMTGILQVDFLMYLVLGSPVAG